MEIKITGTPEEVKELLAKLAVKELVTKKELEKVLADHAKFAKPINPGNFYETYAKEFRAQSAKEIHDKN